MASVTLRRSGKVLRERTAVSAYLEERGVLYESWECERLTGHLKESDVLNPEERQEILSLYSPEIEDLKSRQGYLTQDIVALSGATPNLETMLDTFRREHHHTDDEVRFVVDGSGIFTMRKNDAIFDITVETGDLLVVPAYTRHRFDLTPDRRITCIRIFKDPAGWAARYDEPVVAPALGPYRNTVAPS